MDVVASLRAAGCVFAEEEAELLLAASTSDVEALVRRRVAGEPLEHVLGWASFAGLRVAVGPGVFVPRRRTELLVSVAAGLARPGSVVVDLCCGSGAIGLAVASAVPVELHAADVSEVAVGYARRNLGPLGTVYAGDLFDALPASLRGRVDVLTADVPYVPTDAIATLPPEAREHEPRVALDGGPDGRAVARRVLAGAPDWLAPGGSVLLEASPAQAAALMAGLDARIEGDEDTAVVVVRF